MEKSEVKYTFYFFVCAALLIIAYAAVYAFLGQGLFSHCDYDSYTRQAAAWWEGRASLPGDVSWLELAYCNGNYYVSFPPFPSVAQFVLYPFFGMNTPDNLVNTLFASGSFALIYRFLIRRGYGDFSASLFALLMTLGSNLFYMSVAGWVWFAAQTQGFFFSVLAVSLIFSENKTAWYFSFLSLGIAFACRPFQLVYLPALLYMLYRNLGKGKGFIRTCARCVKYALPLAAVGAAVAGYNLMRFGNIFEFGHNYLPEFEKAPQFSLSYIPDNFLETLKLPEINNGTVNWPMFNGTLFFLVNPVFIMLAASLARRFGRLEAVYAACFLIHFTLLLTHKTMGGFQFGSRYLVDMIPFMLIVFERDESFKTLRSGALALLTFLTVIGIVINVWGAVWYYPLLKSGA